MAFLYHIVGNDMDCQRSSDLRYPTLLGAPAPRIRAYPPEAVGLDPTVPMKDSGVEWLGEIPAHWEVKRLKYLATLNPESLTEDTDPTREMVYVDIGALTASGASSRESN